MEPGAPFLKSQLEAQQAEYDAGLALAGWMNRQAQPEPPEWLGVAPGVAKMAQAEGKVFSYAIPTGKPSDEYLDLILGQLAELGVEIRLNPSPALLGNTGAIPPDLMRSVKACRDYLIDRLRMVRVLDWRRVDEVPLPSPERPVEWVIPGKEAGHCAGEDMPAEWVQWRYLYGPDRHVWHSHSGWIWEEERYAEPIFRKRFKPRRVLAEQARRAGAIPK